MKFKILLICFTFILPCVNAQVTIGSGIPPREGTILDIKEKSDSKNKPNAKGGIGLPRVQLESYDKLTVQNANKSEHVGLMVYNVGGNIPEGIYYWDGIKWRLSVSVDSYGANGQLLTSESSGTFKWSDFVLPEYSFHKPTQISVFNKNNATPRIYSYEQLVTKADSNGDYGGVKPKPAVFEDSIIYTHPLTLHTEKTKDKYLLLGLAATIRLKTISNYTFYTAFWQVIQVDVYLDDEPVQSKQRLYSSAKNATNTINVDMFSVVPLTNNIEKGEKTLKIKISNVENTFKNNYSTSGSSTYPGRFFTGEKQFYTINVVDVNFVLYEED